MNILRKYEKLEADLETPIVLYLPSPAKRRKGGGILDDEVDHLLGEFGNESYKSKDFAITSPKTKESARTREMKAELRSLWEMRTPFDEHQILAQYMFTNLPGK